MSRHELDALLGLDPLADEWKWDLAQRFEHAARQ
jgi:hypothetical protein